MAEKRENELINAKLLLYDNADNNFIDSIGKTERAILKKVISILNGIDTEGGKLVSNETAFNLLNSLNKEVLAIIRRSTFDDRVSAYLRDFEKIDKLNKSLIEEVNDIKLAKVNLNPVKTQAIKDLTEQLTAPSSIDSNLAKPIKDVMFESITTGMTLEEAKQRLNLFISGDEKRLGHIRRWVSQIARDSLTQYDGLVNGIIAREYDLNAYRYVGSLIEDSRPQCVRWVGFEVLPIDTLEREIKWAFRKGSGMIPGTNTQNFAKFRGGYNCRHMAIPFRATEEQIQARTKLILNQ